jgi:hypothetical protein
MVELPNQAPITRTEPTPPFEVKDDRLGDIAIKILGPVTFWGGEVTFNRGDIAHFKETLSAVAKETGFRYSGYFIEHEENLTFHISRLPRRVGLEVPPVEEYQVSLAALASSLQKVGISAHVSEETHHTPQLRSIFGLQEGYYEPRKKDIVAKIEDATIKNIDEAKIAIQRSGLDLERFGIDFNQCSDLNQLTQRLKSTSFTIEHTPQSARNILPAEFSIIPVEIYAVSPDSTYSEPAIRVETVPHSDSLEKLVTLGNAFRQARFSLERPDQSAANNIELLNFSSDKTAVTT